MPVATARAWTPLLEAEVASITITSPQSGETVDDANISATWTFDATQVDYRAQIFSDADGEDLVWDSQWTASAVQGATLATGSDLTSNTVYYLKVWAHGDEGEEAESELVAFYFALPTSVNVEGLVARPWPACEPGPFDNPAIWLSWTQPSPSETFVAYEIRRREAGESAYSRIARIASIATTNYYDMTAKPGTMYEYGVVFYADDATPETLVSTQQDPPARAMVTFDWIYIHELGDTSRFFRIESYAGTVSTRLDYSVAQPWGAQKPTVFMGEAFAHTIQLPALDALRRSSSWRRYEDMMERQTLPGSTYLCVRMGHDRERYFCSMADLAKRMTTKAQATDVTLIEVEYQEDIGILAHEPGT